MTHEKERFERMAAGKIQIIDVPNVPSRPIWISVLTNDEPAAQARSGLEENLSSFRSRLRPQLVPKTGSSLLKTGSPC